MSAIIRVADSFLNIRGSFKIGPLDVKTHSSLVKRKNGKWLMLDSLKMEAPIKREVDELTDGGKNLDAILNLHPFHTVCPVARDVALIASFQRSRVNQTAQVCAASKMPCSIVDAVNVPR